MSSVFLLDKGVDDGELLQQQMNLPWAAYVHEGQRPGTTPVVPYGYYADPSTTTKSANKFGDGYIASLSFYNPVTDCITDNEDDRLLRQQDPFFLLSHLYLHAAMSWTQMINFLEDDILMWQNAREGHLQLALEQLRFNICLIDRITSYLSESLEVIDNHRQFGWPSASTNTLRQQMASIEGSLRSDYRFLILRCQSLLKRAEVSSSSLVREAQLLEAAKGIDQAKKVKSLTLLAYLFLPLSLAAGVFGMNVHELSHQPSIWVFFVVAVGLSLVGAGAAYRSSILVAIPRIGERVAIQFWTLWRRTMK
jgi:CorA-like Mg2+ transporter protein